MLTRPPFPKNIDNSMRSDFRRCAQKFYWKHLRRICRERSNIHLIAGGALAKGLEVARRAFYDQGATQQEAVAKGIGAAVRDWGSAEWPEGKYRGKGLPYVGLGLIKYLTESFPLDQDPTTPWRRPDGSSAVEYSFRHPVPDVEHPDGGPVYYCGRFDMLANVLDMPWVLDDKSTGSIGKTWADQWDLRAQFDGYNWAARENGIETQGTIIRGVRLSTTEIICVEHINPLVPYQMLRWRDQMIRDVKSMLRMWHEGYFDYDLDKSCGDFGGCEFKLLCESERPETWIKSEYVENEWDPMRSDQ